VTLAPQVSLDEFFAGRDESRALFDTVRAAVETIGAAEVRATRSQVAFRRRVAFAWAWIPGRYLRGELAPLVLTVGLHRRDESPRWKQVVEVSPNRFMHHLELTAAEQIDDEVRAWLGESWEQAA